MKKIALAIAVLLSINISAIWAENNSTNTSSVRYVKAPRFARPLVEKWITEYAKTQPGVEFQIAKGNLNQGTIDMNVVFDNQNTKPEDFSHTIVYFGEFAVLPITASGSEAAKVLEGKHLNSKKLKQLYFLNDDFNIFDLQSRHIKEDLTIVSIDVKKNLEENFSDKATLDEVIKALENGKVQEVAVEKIGLSYNQADDAVNQFLQWVLTNGTKYNHEYGLLSLDNKLAQVQIEKVKTILTAQK